MLLQLLGTILLSAFNCALSVESQRSETPSKENPYRASNVVNYLNGGYVLKYVDDFSSNYFNTQLLDHDVTYRYNYNESLNTKVYLPLYDTDMLYSLSECSFFDLNYDYNDNEIYFRFATIDFIDDYEVSFYIGTDFTDLSSNIPNLRYLAIYFDSTFYVNEDVKLLFDTIFTNQLNSYYRSYLGWYTFNNGLGVFHSSFNITSSMLWNNGIYDFWQCTYDDVNYSSDVTLYNTHYTVIPKHRGSNIEA